VDLAPTFAQIAGAKASSTFQGRSFAPLLVEPNAIVREWVVAEHNWHDYQAHERAVRTSKHLYIRNSFPHLPGTPPADAVRSPTFQSMLKLEGEGKLKGGQRGCFATPRPAEELYDVHADPFCLENLAGRREARATLHETRALLDAWIRETKDVVPTKPTPDRFDRQKGTPLAAPAGN
jgi:hypothetical protein